MISSFEMYTMQCLQCFPANPVPQILNSAANNSCHGVFVMVLSLEKNMAKEKYGSHFISEQELEAP